MVPCLSSPGNAPHPRLGHAVAVGLSRPATYEGRSTQCGRSVLWRMVEEGPKEGGAGMRWETIRKDTPPRTAPNLGDYDEECAGFSWWEARARLEGLPGGRGLNIAHEAVDRHAASPRASAVALRCVGRDDSVTCVTYADLSRSTARFANVLRTLGIGHGDRVVTLLGRCPELYTVVLGTLKNTSVLCPLFSAFGPDPVAQRVTLSDAKVLVTTAELYRRKVAGRRGGLAALRHVLIVGEGADELPGTVSLAALMADAADTFTIPPTSPNDMALLHFTSGTTGTPRARYICTRQPSPITRPRSTPSTYTGTTCSGAPPTRAGSPACRMGSSHRSCTARPSWWTRGTTTPAAGTGSSPSSG